MIRLFVQIKFTLEVKDYEFSNSKVKFLNLGYPKIDEINKVIIIKQSNLINSFNCSIVEMKMKILKLMRN